MLRILILLAFAVAGTARANQLPPEVAGTLGNPVLQGSADVALLGFDLYDATLWTDGAGFSFGKPFALSLTYKRNFTANQLTDHTIKEIARIENVPPARRTGLEDLRRCFANVSNGDRITAVRLSSDAIRFFVNGSRSCDYQSAGISRSFFSIWLGEATRDPRGRAQLLGSG